MEPKTSANPRWLGFTFSGLLFWAGLTVANSPASATTTSIATEATLTQTVFAWLPLVFMAAGATLALLSLFANHINFFLKLFIAILSPIGILVVLSAIFSKPYEYTETKERAFIEL
jgi:hypothetical protein